MNAETLLLRQINPIFVQGNKVTSQAFRPTPKDKNELSVYDGDMISPESSWKHFIDQPNCSSVGVMGVTVKECSSLHLPTKSDPKPFPEHAVIDFAFFSKSAIEMKAKQLRANAEARDWIYRIAN